MRAAYYDEVGEIATPQVGAQPAPGTGEVLIQNKAAAVGIWDVQVMRGRFGTPACP